MNTSLSACVSTWSVCGCLYLSLSLSLCPCLSLAHIYLSTWPHPPSSSSSRDGGTGRIINYSRDQIICVSRCRGNSGSFPLPPAPFPFPAVCIFFANIATPCSLSRCSPPAPAMPAIWIVCHCYARSRSAFASPRDFLISLLPQLISRPTAPLLPFPALPYVVLFWEIISAMNYNCGILSPKSQRAAKETSASGRKYPVEFSVCGVSGADWKAWLKTVSWASCLLLLSEYTL